MNEFLGENQKDETESSKRLMEEDRKYMKIKKVIENYGILETERIKANTKNKILKLQKKIILEKYEEIKRIKEEAIEKIKRIKKDSKTEQERVKMDMIKKQEKEIEIIEEYVEKEISKIDAKRNKEILKEKIIKAENNEEDYENKKIIPLNEDSDLQEYGKIKKDKNIKKGKKQENEKGKECSKIQPENKKRK